MNINLNCIIEICLHSNELSLCPCNYWFGSRNPQLFHIRLNIIRQLNPVNNFPNNSSPHISCSVTRNNTHINFSHIISGPYIPVTISSVYLQSFYSQSLIFQSFYPQSFDLQPPISQSLYPQSIISQVILFSVT